MKIVSKVLMSLAIGATVLSANTSTVFEKIESMKKGIDGYIIGKALTSEQQKNATENMLASTNPSVMKFLDGKDLLIAVNSKNKKVLAINKRFNQATPEQIKGIIAHLIHDYDEPTAMAHNKLVYWIFDKDGEKLTDEDMKQWKDALLDKKDPSMPLAEAVNKEKKDVDFNPYISIKLQSDQPMMGEEINKDIEKKDAKLANAYLMISSDKLIKSTTGMK